MENLMLIILLWTVFSMAKTDLFYNYFARCCRRTIRFLY